MGGWVPGSRLTLAEQAFGDRRRRRMLIATRPPVPLLESTFVVYHVEGDRRSQSEEPLSSYIITFACIVAHRADRETGNAETGTEHAHYKQRAAKKHHLRFPLG